MQGPFGRQHAGGRIIIGKRHESMLETDTIPTQLELLLDYSLGSAGIRCIVNANNVGCHMLSTSTKSNIVINNRGSGTITGSSDG